MIVAGEKVREHVTVVPLDIEATLVVDRTRFPELEPNVAQVAGGDVDGLTANVGAFVERASSLHRAAPFTVGRPSQHLRRLPWDLRIISPHASLFEILLPARRREAAPCAIQSDFRKDCRRQLLCFTGSAPVALQRRDR